MMLHCQRPALLQDAVPLTSFGCCRFLGATPVASCVEASCLPPSPSTPWYMPQYMAYIGICYCESNNSGEAKSKRQGWHPRIERWDASASASIPVPVEYAILAREPRAALCLVPNLVLPSPISHGRMSPS